MYKYRIYTFPNTLPHGIVPFVNPLYILQFHRFQRYRLVVVAVVKQAADVDFSAFSCVHFWIEAEFF